MTRAMSKLRRAIEELANQFAMSVIGALREASLEEITSVAGASRARSGRASDLPPTLGRRSRGGARLSRRTPQDIGKMVDDIVGLLAKNPAGLRAEQIRDALACEAKELPRPLADGIQEGRITKSGQKRATTYFVAPVRPTKKRS